MKRTLTSYENPEKRQKLDPCSHGFNPSKYINSDYLIPSAKNISKIKQEYERGFPFRWIMLKDFLDKTFCDNVAKEIEELEWFPKHNDLYTFFQSDDLKKCDQVQLLFVTLLIF
jgi:hypothetical protein